MSYTYDRGRKSTLQPKEWGTVTGGDGKQVNKHMLISWVGAFRGFYKKDESQYSQDFITRMLMNFRRGRRLSLTCTMPSSLCPVHT